MKKSPAWMILALIAVAAGLLLGTTNGVTFPLIQASALAEAESTRSSLFPAADSFRALTLPEGAPVDNCYEALCGGEVAGHVAQITVNGFGGPIEVVAGLDAGGNVTAVSVGGSDFAETAGLGARTREPAFMQQFQGVAVPAALGENVDAVTGATISSTAVVNGVNAIADYIATLG